MKLLCATLVAVLLTFLGAGTHAQDRKLEQAIKHRRAAFTLSATYFSRLLQTVEGNRPFVLQQVVADARAVDYLSRLPWEGFVPGSERGDTRAKEDIWFEEAKFKQMADDLSVKTAELLRAAESGEVKKLKPAFERTRDACDGCHKEFRKK